MKALNDILLKAAIAKGLNDYEHYWGYREDKKGNIVNDIFKAIREGQKHNPFKHADRLVSLNSFIDDCISAGKYMSGRINLDQEQTIKIEEILMKHSDEKARKKILKLLSKI